MAAQGVVCFGLVLLMTVGSNAFFSNNRRATATRPINQTCINLGREGNCAFYGCFEDRLPCGRNGYMLKHGQYYCNKMHLRREDFTPAGQTFLQDSQRCMTNALITFYQQDEVNCHDLKHDAFDVIRSCYQDNAFCSVLADNTDAFMAIYEPGDLFSSGAGSIWRLMARLAGVCGSNAFTSIFQSAWNSLTNIFNR